MFRFRNKIILLLIAVGVLSVAGFVFAQGDLGLNEFGTQTNLGTKPLGTIIAEIVRVFLSVLGVIAVILTLYAGFLWMTAAGEADKIATAKKLLINAVIGLAIILSSLAITQFILGALASATGTNIGAIGGDGPGGGGGLPGDAFTVQGITPSGDLQIRNVVVRVALTHPPDSATIDGNVLVTKKSDNSIASMNFTVNNNSIELTPSASCPPPNSTVKCLDENTAYKVEVKTGLRDTSGNNLICGGFAPNCTAEFVTGSLVDTAPPQVSVTYPDPGQSVPENDVVSVWAKATDDSAISQIDFFADSAYFDKAVPLGPSPAVFEGKVVWNTTGVTRGTHNLSAKAYDVDSNNAISASLSVTVRATHCFNNVKDADEVAIDCGGVDCAACSGDTCTQNSDCVSGSCVGGVCVDTPVILGLSPTDGAPGTYVTISGRYFSTSGTVTFLGSTGPADDKVATLAPCNGAWTDQQIIVTAPQGVVSGPIEVRNTVGADATNDARGPALPNFVVTSILRPGICSLTPSEGKSGTTFSISGTEFGGNQGTSFIKFGNVYAVPQTWANTLISALVPVLSAGENSVQVNRGGVDSNAVTFNVLSLTSGTRPTINYVDPGTGPAGEYITIFGSNFDDVPGVVQFLRADGTVAIGDTNFPQVCAAINYWHNGYITIKIPATFSDGSSTKNVVTNLRVRRADAVMSNSIAFTINGDVPKPGICGISPNNGPIGTKVDVLGERFGSGGTVTFYNNVGATVTAWGTELVQTAVPNNTVSGPVKITVATKDSNSVNFSVSNCGTTPGICTVDQQCCAASCISKTAECLATPKEGAYAWRISTGIIPKVPHVIEDCSVGAGAANPSPSPWSVRPGGNSVCVNAIVNVHFDAKLDPATVIMSGLAADTIALYKCTGVSPAPCATKVKVALDPFYTKLYSVNTTDDGVQMYPASGRFEKDTQYLVELSTKIRGAGGGGGFMEEKSECGAGLSYCFNFKTINSDGLCRVGSLVTSPQNYISDKKEFLEYTSSPRAKDDVCLNINAAAYAYTWSSSQPANAAINKVGFNLQNQPVANAAVIQTISETPPGTPAIITSNIPVENVSGKTNLTIKFADPVVTDKWPFCTTACVNSTIGASFNVDMDPATIIPANISIFVCKTENCDSFNGTLTGTLSYSVVNKRFDFTPAQNLSVNTFYLARLDTLNIRSTSGVALTGANSGRYYIWQFRTRADATPCTVNKVTIAPISQTYNYIPQIVAYTSSAFGSPDSCNLQGQQLNPFSYNWSWNSGASAVVALANNGVHNVLPLSGGSCNSQCLRTGSLPFASVCGNGKIEKGESCDDSNIKNGDGCSSQCLNEGTSAPTCGNNIKNNSEDCDDGNVVAGDGCSASCLAEGSAAGKSICGNDAIGKGETCDDANSVSGDGCSNQCLNEGSLPNIASCGNGVAEKNLGEDCDDGNVVAGDGCSASCLAEGSIAAFAKYGSVCGNNIIESGELCDDGNLAEGDGCSGICLNQGSNLNYGSICGNNAVERGESCDAGTSDSNIDPRQYGIAAGQGITKINASTQNVTGSSDAEVLCVYTSDAQCQTFGVNLGVGGDNCCYVKPQVISTYPKLNQTGVCRNTLLSATFNQLMDGAAGEISIDQRKNGTCPAGIATSPDGLWCLGAIKATRSTYDDAGQTEFNWNINSLLEAGKLYRVILTNFKNKGGVLQMVNPYSWTFTAGNDICKIDKVEVTPAPIIFNNIKPASATNPNGSPREASARAVSFPNNPLSSIPGIYAWDWVWNTAPKKFISLNNTALNPVTITALGQNGEEMLSAQVKFIVDKFNISTASPPSAGTARVIVFLCENPWPGILSFPYQVDTTANASTYYCRDNKPNLLPNLNIVSVPGAGDILKEFLFTDPASGDAIGARIYQNSNHSSPLAWYKSKLFAGNPTASQVDGYEAIVDGRSTYINAANRSGTGNYTNIFVISYSQSASPEMQNIFNQMLKNWKFNTNLQDIGLCVIGGATCSSDLDCASGACQSDKSKIRRDTKRLADFNDIAALLETFKTKSASYPQLLSGSYLRNRSISVWPSWQAALGNDLGTALPSDPINKHTACSGYDSTTCWNGTTGQYICPLGSRVYDYKDLTQDSYRIGADLEYNNGIGWSGIGVNFSIAGNCSGVIQGTSAKCGDGIVGLNEECEKGGVKTESCVMPDGKTGVRLLSCTAATCAWDRSATCQTGQCGDGNKQTNEICDDGQNNGKYGYCKIDCSGIGINCGDGIINGSEQCDKAAQNGVYGSGCSWDCKLPGPICGDFIVQAGNEQCDGNLETKNTAADGTVCPSVIINGTSYPTQNTRTCNPAGSVNQCTFSAWSGCLPAGICGNAIKEGAESCDIGDGGGTSGDCVMDPLKNYSCKLAICGDSYLWTGKEACDSGIYNNVPCIAEYGLTCNYCSNSCSVITKTGPYCGDTVKNGPEECDGNDYGSLTCRDFGFIEFVGQNKLQCLSSCRASMTQCVSVLRVNAGGPDAPASWTDPDTGNVWISDTTYNGTVNALYVKGDTWPGALNTAIDGTTIDKIYQSQRYGTLPDLDLKYNFNIGNGTYKVRLHFAETFVAAENDREFDINIESIKVKSSFNVWKTAGGKNKATVQEFTAIVTDGVLSIVLSDISGKNSPFINGIEVEGSSGAASSAAPPPPPICGDNACNGTETCSSCPGDCGSCYLPPPPVSCTPSCFGKNCGTWPDGCGGTITCGTCPKNGVCQDGFCTEAPHGECVPQPTIPSCDGKCGFVVNSTICGSIGVPCGDCPAGQTCSGNVCVTLPPSCVPSCVGKQCGDDGCGGSCGTCPSRQTCERGICM